MKVENHKAVIELLDLLDKFTKIRTGKLYLRAGEDIGAKQIEYRVGGQKASGCRSDPVDVHSGELQQEIDGDISECLNIGLDRAIKKVVGKLQILGVELPPETASKALAGLDELERVRRKAARVDPAVEELRDMIDGGEECRGLDSQISSVIRVLEGEAA